MILRLHPELTTGPQRAPACSPASAAIPAGVEGPRGRFSRDRLAGARALRPLSGVLAIAGLLMLAGCQDADGARDVLDAAGYGDVRIIPNPGWFTACGEHDVYATHFSAKGPTGVPVEGVVCAGGRSGKGATIRITRVIRTSAGPVAPQSEGR